MKRTGTTTVFPPVPRQALGITHLLGVLPPSPELDRERARVERALECAGLELGLPLS
ncbi:MAG: hypothetical protein R2734_13480 [Nocardioides sp.]